MTSAHGSRHRGKVTDPHRAPDRPRAQTSPDPSPAASALCRNLTDDVSDHGWPCQGNASAYLQAKNVGRCGRSAIAAHPNAAKPLRSTSAALSFNPPQPPERRDASCRHQTHLTRRHTHPGTPSPSSATRVADVATTSHATAQTRMMLSLYRRKVSSWVIKRSGSASA